MKLYRNFAVFCLGLMLTACGGGESEPEIEGCDYAEGQKAQAITGVVYHDQDLSDLSLYEAGYHRGDVFDVEREVVLRGPSGERVFYTCEDGFFAFGGLATGLYHVGPELAPGEWTASKNLASRLVSALDSGSLKMVTIGDSLPVWGGSPRFPALVAERLGELAVVESINAAEAGTESADWIPGMRRFEDLRDDFATADLILISLGGNDVLYFADDKFQAGDIDGLFNGLNDFVAIVLERVRGIVAEIRVENPDVDVAYLLYPNYGRSDAWAYWIGEAMQPTIIAKLGEAIELIRSSITPEDRMLLVDLYSAWADVAPLDDLLVDELHFNAAGHDWVADEFLRAFGCARIGGGSFGQSKHFGLVP